MSGPPATKLLAEHVPLVVDLHAGKAKARYWTCDFTASSVRITPRIAPKKRRYPYPPPFCMDI